MNGTDSPVAPTTDVDGDPAPEDMDSSEARFADADVQDAALVAVEAPAESANPDEGPAPSGPIEFREPEAEGGQQ